MQCSVKTSMRVSAPKATRQAPKTASYNAVSKPVRVVRASAVDNERGAAIAAAAAAAVLLASSPVIASELPSVSNPAADVAVGGIFGKFFDKVYLDPTSKIKEDPFAADRKQASTVGDTKRPIKIPTEQEAVAPEAYPNPAANIAPEPPVLSSAKGDEQYGPNAGQFEGLKEGDRQGLIDKASPAESSRKDKLY